MKARLSISAKILMLSFLNLLLLALVFFVFIRIQYRLDLDSLLLSPGRDRILAISRGLALQLPNTERADWNRLLASYTATTGASVYLFDVEGKQGAGPSVNLPPAVLDAIQHERDQRMAPPDMGSGERPWRPQEDNGAPRPGGPGPDHPGETGGHRATIGIRRPQPFRYSWCELRRPPDIGWGFTSPSLTAHE